jgi:hypothetical protein
MKSITFTLATTTVVLGLATASYGQAAYQYPYLNEVAFTSTGNGTSDYAQSITSINAPGVNVGGFNFTTGVVSGVGSGLGTITYTTTAQGLQYFGLFLDIDNDLRAGLGTAFTDVGAGVGTAPAGETWEVGDAQRNTPLYLYGDVKNNTLPDANTIGVSGYVPPVNPPYGDIAFGLGFTFDNTVAGTETITITSSLTAPGSGFYLEQYGTLDGGSQPNYLSATENFTPAGAPSVPDGGSTLSALMMGLMALTGFKYRFMRK